MIDDKLLEVIACPKCKGEIKEKEMFLTCRRCEIAFPVLDKSVPNMIIEESWPIKKAEKSKFTHKLVM
ncbi:MAG: Trm112 family protein [Candidatus Aenigmarchaeota archaeon]|nr:Trm112 family protein [Candidatus Aenigmarchaeota archaeon]